MEIERNILILDRRSFLEYPAIPSTAYSKVAFKYYISALEGGGGLTENADAADASREGGLRLKLMI